VLTVDDVEQSVRLYGEALGLRAQNAPAFRADLHVSAFGHGGESRSAIFEVPTSGLALEFKDFRAVDRRVVKGRIQDFGSTRLQLRVRDIDAAIAEFIRFGGEVVSTGGAALELPAGNSTLRAAIVRDPNNLFVVLIEGPTASAQRCRGFHAQHTLALLRRFRLSAASRLHAAAGSELARTLLSRPWPISPCSLPVAASADSVSR